MIDVAELVADLTARLEQNDDTELDEAVAGVVLLALDLACQLDELTERVAALEQGRAVLVALDGEAHHLGRRGPVRGASVKRGPQG